MDIITQIYHDAKENMKKYPTLRKGQALYNALYDINPSLATAITGTMFDPFYNDERIPDFIERVKFSYYGTYNN